MEALILIFVLVGIILIIIGIIIAIARKNKKHRCNCQLTAIITGVKHFGRTSTHKARNFGVYEYHYQGKTYFIRSYVGRTGSPKIGKMVTIYVNPYNPQDCIVEGWVSTFATGLFIGLGCIFIVSGIVFGIILQ